MIRRIVTAALAVALALTVAACGGGSSEGSGPSTTTADPSGADGGGGGGEDGGGGPGESDESGGGADEIATLSGTLDADDDDGCVTVTDADGVVWKVLVDPSVEGVSFVFGDPTGVIVNDEGQGLAGLGDEVEVEGMPSEEPPYCAGAERSFTVTRFVQPDPAEAFPTEVEGVLESANGDQCPQLRGDDGTVYELVLDSEAEDVQIVNDVDGQLKLFTSDAQLIAGPGARLRVTGTGWVFDPSDTCPDATVSFSYTAIEVVG